jgi:hypothetical protein
VDILCDIDGTVADCSHRLHWIKNKPKNWKAFFGGVKWDTPIEPTIRVIKELLYSGNQIIYCSGRPDSTRDDTTKWLTDQGLLSWSTPLYMRSTGDYRADEIVKEELLTRIKQDGFKPEAVFDDRQRVIEMWRRNGLFVFDVSQGKGDF